MDKQLIEALLKARRLAYAVTDRSLRIQEVHDPHGLLDLQAQDPRGISLYEVAPEPKRFFASPGAGHNDTYVTGGEAYWQAWKELLDSI